ncbi:MAG TPA: ABC transporter permease [Chryseosolibacter sp.]
MIRHYITVALRAFSRSKAYSIINLLGLTLGVTCSILIFLFVYDEFTYDRNHSKIDGIYRLNGGWRSVNDGTSQMYATVGYNEGEVLKRDFSEIDKVVRFRRFWDARIEKPNTNDVLLEYVYAIEPGLFDVLDIDFVHGNPKNALTDDNSIIITEKSALKYFGSTDVVGRNLRWFAQDTTDFKITGVIADYPENTHLKLDFLVNLKAPTNLRDQWFEYGYYTLFTLHPGSDIADVQSRIKHFTKKDVQEVEKEIGFIAEHDIISLADVHLYANYPGELEQNSKAAYVYIFAIVGVFILVMACINFMNLATARSMTRAKEIGVRKVIGAVKHQLVRQFLGEAFLTTFMATALSIGLVYALLPFVNEFTGKHLTFLNETQFWVMIASVVVLVSLLAGFYPAFYLSAFKPSETLKGVFKRSDKGIFVRQTLVVFQFTLSIALIAGIIIIWNHITFMRDKDLGFNKDQVIVITGAPAVMKEQIAGMAGVEKVTFSNRVPGYSVGGRTIIKGWDKSDTQLVLGQLAVDHDFVNFYDLELVAGRAFDEKFPSDEKEAFLINESAMRLMGFTKPEDAIGQKLWLEDWGGKKGTVIGVLKDFHFIGVNSAIEPFSMFLHPNATRYFSIRVSSANIPELLSKIESVFKQSAPGRPFQYSFLDEEFDKQYKSEERFMTVFSVFASLAIVIACLGLYGLANFMTEQRTKEIGVRKVLGASVSNILTLVTKDFLKLVCIAFVISIPIAWFAMNRWLDAFPYREEVSPMVFVLTGVVVFAITIFVVSYQAVSAATTNPVKSLRTE